MVYVGIDEAATRLKELIQSVEEGEAVTIMREGYPVAEIARAARNPTAEERQETMRRFLDIRAHSTPTTAEEIRAWRDEGRR